MKYSKFLLSLVLVVLFSGTGFSQTQPREINWKAFSVNLVKAIKSGHPGLQQSAMQRIIQYADKLDVDDAVWTISRIERFSDDCRVRRLAMVTLYKIHSAKAMSYIVQNLKYEEDSSIKKQGCCLVQDYYLAKNLKPVSENALTIK